jgi:hypothetical protein
MNAINNTRSCKNFLVIFARSATIPTTFPATGQPDAPLLSGIAATTRMGRNSAIMPAEKNGNMMRGCGMVRLVP